MSGREATAASVFFLLGQLGFGIGPMIGGPLLVPGNAWTIVPIRFHLPYWTFRFKGASTSKKTNS